MHSSNEWYTILNTDTIDSPALVVYPDRIRENIRLLKSMSKGLDWLRPHVKTHKMAEVAAMMLEEGIYKFKCATIAEAEMLALAGATDVLLAYQPVGPKINRLLQLVLTYPTTQFSCLVDNLITAQAISEIFSIKGKTIRVFLDLNIGMNRTGILPGEEAFQLYTACSSMPGVEAVGLHAYDGHLRETDLTIRKQKCDQGFAEVEALARKIAEAGMPSPILVAGGSPSYPIHAQREGVECSPGTFIFWDYGYKNTLPEQNFQYAALVMTRVISIIDDQTICLDLGHKAVAAENPLPRVHFLNAPDIKPISQSEEHMVATVVDSSDYQLGDVLYGVPVHICPTCALYDQAQVIENHRAVNIWKVVARNRVISV
ncbi:D-TA family PLP-dependent enzyme [Rhodocytophaga rosea]|uniref:D-TA family PLP-dependent enzyme n=1 Tax=Rhodocytophaga rosea TaxID=2704465 RepID=A0A6C0GR58_9BACT|nr:D-TA family PLP-dependent enzyme [Rhodocytophaga rosea]QHT70575.1 D-TA family PLP-dependent enzyme [Rhodocytophaga rosea]